MYNLVRNLLLVVVLVAVALVLVRVARQGDAPAVPAAAIRGGGNDLETASKRDQELPPRVLQVNPTTEESGDVSPLEGDSYDFAPTGGSMSPVPSPIDLPGVDRIGSPAAGTPTAAVGGEYRLPSPIEGQAAEDAVQPPAADSEETDAAVTQAIAPAAAPQQSTSWIITGPDDSFWSISEKAYNSRAYYRALFRHNRNAVLRPDQLKAGIEIEVPPLETLRRLYPTDFPADTGDG